MKQPRPMSPRYLAMVFTTYLGLVGLIAGLIYSLGGALYDVANGGLNVGTALAFLAIVGMPLLAALIGLLVGYGLAHPAAWILTRLLRVEVIGEKRP